MMTKETLNNKLICNMDLIKHYAKTIKFLSNTLAALTEYAANDGLGMDIDGINVAITKEIVKNEDYLAATKNQNKAIKRQLCLIEELEKYENEAV